jgi:hypothetical protein
MPHRDTHLADRARRALGVVRLVNGALGIVAPGVLIRRLGGDPAANPAARYAFRLFGVRTILLAAELLLATGPVRERARRIAVIVHASDTAIAVWGLWRRELPPRVALVTVAISAGNTVLAVLSRPRRLPRNRIAEPITHVRRQRGPGSGRP